MFKKVIGRRGEEIAVGFLKKTGLKVIERNFSCRLGEIDIIAKDADEVVFVEVRSTSEGRLFKDPLESVSYAKMDRLRKLVSVWLKFHGIESCEIRFDVIGIIFKDKLNSFEIKYIKNAF